jgi:LmbE family N-acetylglucosaminyl deacetylase/glycosyltransferase involved in cell wall biosynthesis
MIQREHRALAFSSSERSVVVAPHADDETFGMGGTLLKMSQQGVEIHLVVMTDGGKGGDREQRRDEVLEVASRLTIKSVRFLDQRDGSLQVLPHVVREVTSILVKLKPHHLFFPSPLESHADHKATAWIVWSAVRQMRDFRGIVYSYEISSHAIANTFVDITALMDQKIALMHAYPSQLSQYPYLDIVQGINRSRSYAFPPKVQFVEAFFTFPDTSLDMMSYYYEGFSTSREQFALQKMPLVSILIRTKDRLALLERALDSIANQSYQHLDIQIINDAGEAIEAVVQRYASLPITLSTHETTQGRARSANRLLDHAKGAYLLFLDDDDTIDSDHIHGLLKRILENPHLLAVYSGVRVGEGLEDQKIYNEPFDRRRLRYKNYIPIHALLFSRTLLEKGCRFDEAFEIYEDWDFWLQLSEHTTFYHLDRVTATYHIHGGSGAGASVEERDRLYWRMKLYDKWIKRWSSQDIYDTFEYLKKSAIAKHEALKKELTLFKQKLLNQKIQCEALESKVQRHEAQRNNTEAIIETLLSEKIASEDRGSMEGRRDFRIVSTRGHEEECQELFQEVFKKPMSGEFWNWKYHGSAWRGVCAEKNGKIIGHYNGMVRDILYFGRRTKAIQPCDVMVSKEARGGFRRGSPFYAMVMVWAGINVGENRAFLLSYGFPNRRAFLLGKKMGIYQEVDTISLLHWSAASISKKTHRLVERYKIKSKITSGAVNHLWLTMAKDFRDDLIGVRDVAYLKRRYLKHPHINYQLYSVQERGELVAIFVLKRAKNRTMLMDMIAPKEVFTIVIEEALRIIASYDQERLECWMTTSHQLLFDCWECGIEATDISIPASAITQGVDPEHLKNRWFLMYGDSDFL